MSVANRLGRRSAGHVCRRAAAGQRTCWRIEEEQDRIENAAWADWTQCQEVRADDILLLQTNVAAASGLSATADPVTDPTAEPMMCIGSVSRVPPRGGSANVRHFPMPVRCSGGADWDKT